MSVIDHRNHLSSCNLSNSIKMFSPKTPKRKEWKLARPPCRGTVVLDKMHPKHHTRKSNPFGIAGLGRSESGLILLTEHTEVSIKKHYNCTPALPTFACFGCVKYFLFCNCDNTLVHRYVSDDEDGAAML